MSDLDRIARRLRAVGVVSPLDFDGSREIVDGGEKAIKRMAARIGELRNEHGWRIKTTERDGMALYVLVAEPGQAAVEPDPVLEEAHFDRTIPPVDDVIAQWAEGEAA